MTPVTFLMAVHNGAGTVAAAMESVLGQTFGDFEFLIVDDGSSDGSGEVALSFGDRRVRVLVNEKNVGLSAALNRGLREARGEFVARMDADDMCMPERAARQVEFLRGNKDVAVVGSFVETFGEGAQGKVIAYPTEADAVGATLLFRSALAHPAVMFRREALARHGLSYEEKYWGAQDYALWLGCVEKGLRLANIGEVLLRYRVHGGQLSAAMEKMQGEGTVIRSRFLKAWSGEIREEELALHDMVSRDFFEATDEFVAAAVRWLKRLAILNEARPRFGREALLRVLTGRFVALWRFAKLHGLMLPEVVATPFGPYVHADALRA